MLIDTKTKELSYMEGNLWEAITHAACDECDGKRTNRALAYEELQRRLGECACMSWQEIGIEPHPEGWLITIHACNESGKVQILIPKSRNRSIQVLCDTRAHSFVNQD